METFVSYLRLHVGLLLFDVRIAVMIFVAWHASCLAAAVLESLWVVALGMAVTLLVAYKLMRDRFMTIISYELP